MGFLVRGARPSGDDRESLGYASNASTVRRLARSSTAFGSTRNIDWDRSVYRIRLAGCQGRSLELVA